MGVLGYQGIALLPGVSDTSEMAVIHTDRGEHGHYKQEPLHQRYLHKAMIDFLAKMDLEN